MPCSAFSCQSDTVQKFIHITDTHFVPPGNLLYGLNPIDRWRSASPT